SSRSRESEAAAPSMRGAGYRIGVGGRRALSVGDEALRQLCRFEEHRSLILFCKGLGAEGPSCCTADLLRQDRPVRARLNDFSGSSPPAESGAACSKSSCLLAA